MPTAPKRPGKHRVEGGRVTPKGGAAKDGAPTTDAGDDDLKSPAAKYAATKDASAKSGSAKTTRSGSGRTTTKSGNKRTTVPEASTRYTPRVPTYQKVSPPWVPVLMFGFIGLGIAMIVANYMNFLPGAVTNWYVFGGLGLILAGIITATQYR